MKRSKGNKEENTDSGMPTFGGERPAEPVLQDKPRRQVTDPFKPVPQKNEPRREFEKRVENYEEKVTQSLESDPYIENYEERLEDELIQVHRMQEERKREIEKRKEEVEKRNKLANHQFRRDEAELQRELQKGSVLKESRLQPQKAAVSPYAKLFKDKDSVKKAFIMSEIFNRRYD